MQGILTREITHQKPRWLREEQLGCLRLKSYYRQLWDANDALSYQQVQNARIEGLERYWSCSWSLLTQQPRGNDILSLRYETAEWLNAVVAPVRNLIVFRDSRGEELKRTTSGYNASSNKFYELRGARCVGGQGLDLFPPQCCNPDSCCGSPKRHHANI